MTNEPMECACRKALRRIREAAGICMFGGGVRISWAEEIAVADVSLAASCECAGLREEHGALRVWAVAAGIEIEKLRAELATANEQIRQHQEWLKRDSQYAENQRLAAELAAANQRADRNARLLLEAISISDGRRKTLFEKSDELREAWQTAERANAERDAARKYLADAVTLIRGLLHDAPDTTEYDNLTQVSLEFVARFDAQRKVPCP